MELKTEHEEFGNLTFEQIKGGAALEQVNAELQLVYNDIADLNKVSNQAREVNVKIIFAPNEDGLAGAVVVRVSSKFARQKDVGSTVFFGIHGGKGLCGEQVRNQLLLPNSVQRIGDSDDNN